MFADVCNDLFAVETTIFNEDFIGVAAGNDHAGKINSRDIALACFRIAVWPGRSGIDFNADVTQEIKIGMISGECINVIVLNASTLTLGVFEPYGVRRNFFDGGFHVCPDGAFFNAVLDVGANPIFDVPTEFSLTVDYGDLGPVPE